MIDVFIESLVDSLKIVPFLFLSFLLIEILEKKTNIFSIEKLRKNQKIGPLYGVGLGIIPQCGMSAASAGLYATRVISLGTLMAVFLATSDEAFIIMLAHPEHYQTIGWLILSKAIMGIVIGFSIDFILRKREVNMDKIGILCDNCGCEKSILKAVINHSVKIFIYILIVALLFNSLVFWIGEETIKDFMLTNSLFQPFLTSLIGLIPNCAPSVLLTNLYIEGLIGFGSILSGLLTNAGIGVAILFKVNKNLKENLTILGLLYVIGVTVGLIVNVFL